MKKIFLFFFSFLFMFLVFSSPTHATGLEHAMLGPGIQPTTEEDIQLSSEVLSGRSDDIEHNQDEIKEKLIGYSSELEIRNIFTNVFRQIKKTLLGFVYSISESVEEGFYEVVNYLDLISSSEAYGNLEKNLRPVIISLLILGLSLSAVYMIYRKPSGEQKDILMNLLLVVGLFVLLPTLTNLLISATQSAVKEIPAYFNEEDNKVTSVSESLFQIAFSDLKKASDRDFPLPVDKASLQTTLPGSYIKAMTINEVLDRENGSSVLSYELAGDGVLKIEEAGFISRQTGLDAYSPAYYRWSISFLFPFLSMLVLLLVYLFAAFRTARLILDIAINRVFVFFTAPLHLSNVQKIKEILMQMVLGYLQIFGIAFTVAMYGLLIALINQTSMSFLLKTIFFLGAGYGAIDGSKFFEQIFRVDMGIRSEQAMLGALMSPVRQMKRIATAPLRGIQKIRKIRDDHLNRLQQKAYRTHSTQETSRSAQKKRYRDIAKGKASFPEESQIKNSIPKSPTETAENYTMHRAFANENIQTTQPRQDISSSNKDPIEDRKEH